MSFRSDQGERGAQSSAPLISIKHDLTGSMLESLSWLGLANKWQRIRRKRFRDSLHGQGLAAWRMKLTSDAAGRALEAAIGRWAGNKADDVSLPAMSGSEATKRASIIINSDNRVEELSQTLSALEGLGLDQEDELIVVLGPTDDGSVELVSDCSLTVRTLRCPERNLSLSRNIGLTEAAGEFVVYLDDDASPQGDWMDQLLKPFGDPRVSVVAGHVWDGDGSRPLNRYVVADVLGGCKDFADAQSAEREISHRSQQRAFLTATGCNMAIRRAPLMKLGGFDPHYIYFLEETDVVYRLILDGANCAVAPDSVVNHRLAPNIVRDRGIATESMLTLLRSHLRFVGKFGRGVCEADRVEDSVWVRILGDLEKICWSCATVAEAASKQRSYLDSVVECLQELEG